MKKSYTTRHWLHCLVFTLGVQTALAQNVCPPNIDFEYGNWTNWQLYAGFVDSDLSGTRTYTLNPSAPLPNRHTIIPPTSVLDPYGGFPMNSNGAAGGTSIRLGFPSEAIPDANCERIRYQFTIPAGATSYSLTYKYAVVFENPSGHQPYEQPQFEAKVINVTTGQYIPCASFSYYATSGLPGFSQSTQLSNHNAVVYYRPWTAVTVNLSAYAGQTIALEFTNSDCTLTGHWAYSYIDVNTGCDSPIAGAEFCPGSSSVNVIAPYGYQSYTWYNAGFGTPLTTNQTLTLTPPPATPTIYAVDVVPYPGYGCRDTIYATVRPLPTVPVNAGIDKLICPTGITNLGADTLGSPSLSNYTYSWLPAAGLSDPAIAQPLANPSATTSYVLTMTDAVTGCNKKDTVVVTLAEPVTATFNVNDAEQCLSGNNYQFTSSSTNPAGTIYAWIFEGTTGSSQANPSYQYPIAGTYNVSLQTTTPSGCQDTSSQVVIVNVEATADAGVDQTLCGSPSASTVIGSPALPGYTYSWSPATNLDNPAVAQPVASPTATSTYIVTATTAGGCTKKDTVVLTIVPNLSPAFTVNNSTQCIDVNNFQFTISNPLAGLTYSWNFGDTPPGTSSQQNPSYSYTTAGIYTVKVNLLSPNGCKDSSTQTVTVKALPTGTISAADTIICEGSPAVLTVSGTPANTYKWYLNGTILAGTTTTPSFNATQPGIYTVTLDDGCVNNGTGSITLSLTKKPIVDFTFDASCLGVPTVFTDGSTVAGSLPVDYVWNFGDSPPGTSTQPSPTYQYPKPGTYNAQFTVTPQNCPSLATTITKPVTVKGPTPNTRYADKAALENVPLQLQARSIGSSYSWSPGTNLNNASIMAPVFQGLQEVDYIITITDNLGCVTVDSQLVRVIKEVNIYMPKAFTPNGDGQNDRIFPFTVGIKQIKLFRIMNRWGVIVYEAKTDNKGWDGIYKGAPQPMDGYVWELQAVDYFGKMHTRQGSFTLIR